MSPRSEPLLGRMRFLKPTSTIARPRLSGALLLTLGPLKLHLKRTLHSNILVSCSLGQISGSTLEWFFVFLFAPLADPILKPNGETSCESSSYTQGAKQGIKPRLTDRDFLPGNEISGKVSRIPLRGVHKGSGCHSRAIGKQF